jgi:outer membrane protein assembly factor BamB
MTLDAGAGSYVAQLGPTGTCAWSRLVPGSSPAVTLLPSGVPLVTATFAGTVDVGCGPMTSGGGTYVALLDATGACTWSQSADVTGLAVSLFPSGDVLATAPFAGTIGFAGASLTSAGAQDLAVARLAGPTGAPVWRRAFGGAGATLTASASTDALGNVFLTAQNAGAPVDFGGGATPVGTFGAPIPYALKLNGDGSFRFQVTAIAGGAALDPCGALIVANGPNGAQEETFQKLAP